MALSRHSYSFAIPLVYLLTPSPITYSLSPITYSLNEASYRRTRPTLYIYTRGRQKLRFFADLLPFFRRLYKSVLIISRPSISYSAHRQSQFSPLSFNLSPVGEAIHQGSHELRRGSQKSADFWEERRHESPNGECAIFCDLVAEREC